MRSNGRITLINLKSITMKLKTTIKNLAILVVMIMSSNAFAQDGFQGQAIYMSKTTVDMDSFGGREMSLNVRSLLWSV